MIHPSLHWKEIEALSAYAHSELQGMFFEKIVIPERKHFSDGFLKHECWFRFQNSKGKKDLWLSFRQNSVFFSVLPDQKGKSSTRATLSPFLQYLQGILSGSKIKTIQSKEHDRIVVFEYSKQDQHYELWFEMIPQKPSLQIIEIQNQTRTLLMDDKKKFEEKSDFTEPKKPLKIYKPETVVRSEIQSNFTTWNRTLLEFLEQEAFEERKQSVDRILKAQTKKIEQSLEKENRSLDVANQEESYKKLADAFQAEFYQYSTSPLPKEIFVSSLEGEEKLKIEVPSKISKAKDLLQDLYKKAKRKESKIRESLRRKEEFEEKITKLHHMLEKLKKAEAWSHLQPLEKSLGIQPGSPQEKRSSKKFLHFSGKKFLSSDRLEIWVGRNQKENMDLCFRFAKGQDVWFHIKDRASAHALIFVPKNKSAPLSTMLEACHLVIYYSGGKEWGKTNVDYTLKKNLKKIKGSSEVFYTHAKTITIEIDQDKMREILSREIVGI